MECLSCFKSIFEPDESKKDKDVEEINTIHILDDIVVINKDTKDVDTKDVDTKDVDVNTNTETIKENFTEKENETETDKNKLIFPIVIDEMYCK